MFLHQYNFFLKLNLTENKKMEYPLTRRNPPTPTPPSPRLVRSRSGAENNSTSINTSQRFASQRYTGRSKSTTPSSPNRRKEEKINNPSSTQQKKLTNSNGSSSNRDGFVRFLQRPATVNNNNKMPKSATSSPSAWALSPGRSSLFNPWPHQELPENNGGGEKRKKGKSGGGGGAVSVVLKYFKQKKGSSVKEDEYHKFRVLHNRLLQWRFANAQAETVMTSTKKISENKLFHVWVRILNVRNTILEKKIQIIKLKQEVKLCDIVNGEMRLLNDWAKIEKKNCEVVGRITRKLSALSLKLPLVEEATGDVESVYKAMRTAVEVMGGIESTISKFFSQVEKILYLLTELTSTIEDQNEILEETEKIVPLIVELLAWERSIRVQLMQVVEESRSDQGL